MLQAGEILVAHVLIDLALAPDPGRKPLGRQLEAREQSPQPSQTLA
jgi:hypothetical protein